MVRGGMPLCRLARRTRGRRWAAPFLQQREPTSWVARRPSQPTWSHSLKDRIEYPNTICGVSLFSLGVRALRDFQVEQSAHWQLAFSIETIFLPGYQLSRQVLRTCTYGSTPQRCDLVSLWSHGPFLGTLMVLIFRPDIHDCHDCCALPTILISLWYLSLHVLEALNEDRLGHSDDDLSVLSV